MNRKENSFNIRIIRLNNYKFFQDDIIVSIICTVYSNMYLTDYLIDIILKIVIYGKKSNDNQKKYLYMKHSEFSPKILNEEQIPKCSESHIRLLIISDSHEKHETFKIMVESDVFIHCGDVLTISRLLSRKAGIQRLIKFNTWLGTIPSKSKILIAGNHDKPIELLGKESSKDIFTNAIYLQNDQISIGNISVWGTPLSSGSSRNKAFQSKEFEAETNDKCPDIVDILITHGQCPELEKKISHKIHLWGHNHNSYGIRFPGESFNNEPVVSLSVCAPVMDGNFAMTNCPILIDIPKNIKDDFIFPSSRKEFKGETTFAPNQSSYVLKTNKVAPI